jgi:hypothetical protein
MQKQKKKWFGFASKVSSYLAKLVKKNSGKKNWGGAGVVRVGCCFGVVVVEILEGKKVEPETEKNVPRRESGAFLFFSWEQKDQSFFLFRPPFALVGANSSIS